MSLTERPTWLTPKPGTMGAGAGAASCARAVAGKTNAASAWTRCRRVMLPRSYRSKSESIMEAIGVSSFAVSRDFHSDVANRQPLYANEGRGAHLKVKVAATNGILTLPSVGHLQPILAPCPVGDGFFHPESPVTIAALLVLLSILIWVVLSQIRTLR